jgi:CRISPR/Cas system-associated protein Cas7 (RAMP superfamily)
MEQKFNDKILYKETETWHWYDKMLFNLYHKSGNSIRQLSKDTSISATNIFKNLKSSQEKLNKKFGINYQEYRKTINK